MVDTPVTCDPDAGMGGFANSIVVSDPNDDPANNDACVMVPDPDITVDKQVTDPVAAGGELTFTITAMNIGAGVANNVAIEDTLPVGLELLSTNSSIGSFDTNTNISTVGSMLPGTSETLEVVVMLDVVAGMCGPEYLNVPEPATSSVETNLNNNTSDATAFLVAIGLAKEMDGQPTAITNGELGHSYSVTYN